MAIRIIKRPSRKHEAELWSQGFEIVVGVDEVGRGSWAGPVVAAAVVLPRETKLRGIRDSKLLSGLQRQQLNRQIKLAAQAIGVGWASHRSVDEIGLTAATRLSAERALAALTSFDAILLDGKHNYLESQRPTLMIVKADRCCLSVAAASIVAKEARDRYMRSMHRLYPAFGFDRNVGYGTRHHQRQLMSGLSPIHRRSYAPIKLALGHGN